VLLESEMLKGGEDALVQVRLESPVVAERDDLFVLRSYSPVTTIAGGRVIDPDPDRHRRLREEVIESIHVLESGSPSEVLLKQVEDAGTEGLSRDAVEPGAVADAVADAVERGDIVPAGGRLLTKRSADELSSRILEILEGEQRKDPLAWGTSAEELRGRLGKTFDRRLLEWALDRLGEEGAVFRRDDLVRAGSPEVELTPAQREAAERILSVLGRAGAAPPDTEALREEVPGEDIEALLRLLAAEGRVVKVTTTVFYHRDVIDRIRRQVIETLDAEGELSVPAFKDLVGVTRKHAIPLLEFLDREGTTIRAGNVRRRGRSA
jgi:selenocysteine-specific elongation factor